MAKAVRLGDGGYDWEQCEPATTLARVVALAWRRWHEPYVWQLFWGQIPTRANFHVRKILATSLQYCTATFYDPVDITGIYSDMPKPISNEHRERLARARERSLEVRRQYPKRKRQDAEMSVTSIIHGSSPYLLSGDALATDDEGRPSLANEFTAYLQTREGCQLLRRIIRTAVVKAAYGDTQCLRLVFGELPMVARPHVDIADEIRAEINAEAPLSMSPAERRRKGLV